MDGAGNGGSGTGGGPAPFLLKTYDMVNDPITDDIVSWTHTKRSFVVWNTTDFAARLLPTYFKHNNFSSFIRQLNTYGFHKIDPERWEFANEYFIQGQKVLLKNIHRRKPIHSHSNPPAGAIIDSERTFLEEQIEKLNKDKANLEAALWKFKQQQSGTVIQLEDLERRLADMEQRQLKMITFLKRASDSPHFMENLVKMATASSLDLYGFQKKRRLPPGLDSSLESPENSFPIENSCTSKKELCSVLHKEFCDKLKLELCSAHKEDNLVMASTQSSIEDAGNSQGKQKCDEIMESLPLVPDAVDLSDTGASICPRKNISFRTIIDDGDVLFPCHLSLALASSTTEVDRIEHPNRAPNSVDQGVNNLTNSYEIDASIESGPNIVIENSQIGAIVKATALQQVGQGNNNKPEVPPTRLNDGFWEQFFTEKPGVNTEETNPRDQHKEE